MGREIAIGLLNLVVMSAAGCSGSVVDGPEKGRQMPERIIEQVQEAHTDEWMAIPGVEGTAIGLFKGKPCIKIFASVKSEKLRSKIPSSVEGYPVIIEETGTFRPLEPQ
ncbi:MAG: hypothetical protein AAB393_00190 [Bacteroidota bacterium]